MKRAVNIKTTEDYLALVRQLDEILKERGVAGDEDKKDKVRKELLDSGELKLRGVDITGDEVNEVFRFRRMKKLRDSGKSWLEILNTEAYSDVPESNRFIIDLLEYETGKTIKSGKDILDLIGDGELWERKTDDKDTLKDLQSVYLVTQEERLSKKIAEMIDDGKTWKDLISIDLKEYGLEEWRSKGPLSYESYEDFLVNEIGYYFHYLDYSIVPLKPSYVVEILEAPRALEFELKKHFERGYYYQSDGYLDSLSYLLREDAEVRVYKRHHGEEVIADTLNKAYRSAIKHIEKEESDEE